MRIYIYKVLLNAKLYFYGRSRARRKYLHDTLLLLFIAPYRVCAGDTLAKFVERKAIEELHSITPPHPNQLTPNAFTLRTVPVVRIESSLLISVYRCIDKIPEASLKIYIKKKKL